jgi:hypothetical protein
MTSRILLGAVAVLVSCATPGERAATAAREAEEARRAREERRALEREACLHAENPPWLDGAALARAIERDEWQTDRERSRVEERAREEKDERQGGRRPVVVVAPRTTERDRIILEREDFWRRCALLRDDERAAGPRPRP